MKRTLPAIFKYILLFTFALLLVGIVDVEGANFFSRQSGNWNATATWSHTSGGGQVSWGDYPGVGDNVIIEGNRTVTLNANSSCTGLTISSGSTLARSTFLLTLYGNFINNGNETGIGGVTIAGGANQSIAGFTTTGSVTMDKTAGTATLSGNVTASGLTLDGSGTLNLGAGLTHTFSGVLTLHSGSLNGGSSILNINGSTNLTGVPNWDCGTGTVDYGGGEQVVLPAPYYNLTLSGSGAKTFYYGAPPAISGILSMEGTATVSATPTYGAGATLQYKGASSRTAGAEFPNNFAGSGGLIIDQGSGNVVTLNANKTALTNIHIKSGTLDLSTYTANRGGAGGTLTIAANGTLRIGGTNTFPSNYSTHVIHCASTVEYDGGNQTVANLNSSQKYGNLILRNGTKTLLTGTTSICNDFTIDAATTTAVVGLTIGGDVILERNYSFNPAAFTHNVGGNWTFNGWSTFNPGAGTINFTGNNSAINGTTDNNQSFNNITVSKSSGQSLSVGGSIATLKITNNLVLTSGNFSPGTIPTVISGNWTNNGGTYTSGTGMITMNGSGKTIGGSSSTTFNNLNIANNGNGILLGRDQFVNGTLTLSNGLLKLGVYNLTLGASAPAISGEFWTANMVVADGTGELRKMFTANGSYTFPIGDNSDGTANVSPITLNFTSGTYPAGAYVGVRVTNAKHPDNTSATHYLKRYWTVAQSGISAFACNVTCNYGNSYADVIGQTGLQIAAQYTSTNFWIGYSTLADGNLTAAGVTSFGDFTGVEPSIISNLSTGPITGSPFCAGSVVSVPFNSSSTFSSGNVFTAQLSNSTGDFTSPVAIGTLTSTTAGIIPATIPAGSSAGTGYRIRVISSSPARTGTDNGTGLTINVSPSAPEVGAITQPTCALPTGSVLLSELPPTWTLIRNPGGVITTGTGTSTTITGLSPGTHTFSVSDGDNTSNCPVGSGTGLTGSYFNNMTLAGTAALTRTDATVDFTWGTGSPATGINANNFSVRWTGMVQACYTGNYTFTTRSDDGIRLWVNGVQLINQWNDHSAANHSGTISLTAGEKYEIVLEFYENATDAVAQLSWTPPGQSLQLIPQSQLFPIVTTGCTSVSSGSVVINAIPTAPATPTASVTVQPTCAEPTGTIVITAPIGGTYQYQLDGGTYQASATFTGVSVGNHTVKVRLAASPTCISSASAALTVSTVPTGPATPTVGTITQPTCATATGSVALSGLPSTGFWTLTRNPGAVTTTGTGTTTTISGLVAGTYTYTVTNGDNSVSCPGTGTGLLAEYYNTRDLAAPAVLTRTDANIDNNWGNGGPGTPINNDNFSVRWTGMIQPCFTENYTFTTSSDDGIRLWVDGTQIINNWNDHGTTTNTGNIDLIAGQKYTIKLEYYENGGVAVAQLSWNSTSQALQIIPQTQLFPSVTTACTSSSSDNVVINAVPTAPATPTASITLQPTCAVPTGTIVISAPSGAAYEYQLDAGTYQTSPTFTGVAVGNHSVKARLKASTTCVSLASANLAVNTVPAVPTSPTVGTITQPSCVTSTGSVVLSGLPSGTWTLTRSPGGTTTGTGASTTISGLTEGTYSYTVTNSAGCISPVSGNVIINAQPLTAINSQQTGTQTVCLGGAFSNISVTATGVTGYQWYRNTSTSTIGGISLGSVNGAQTATYTPQASTAGTLYYYYCIVSGACGPITSNISGAFIVNPNLPVSISIAASANPVCTGTSVTFTASPTNGGTAPAYQWKVNGVNAGTNSSTYTYTPVNNDAVTCVLSSTAPCASGSPATSNSITMDVAALIGNNLVDNVNGAQGVICGTANENGNVILTAPVGTIFTNVGFASYGVPTGACPVFALGTCHSLTSQSVSEGYLLGNNSANIPATNGVFTDPCVGTVKRLYVLASYTEPVCSGNIPGTITGALPTGGNGTYTYLWESSIVGPSSGFAAASGTNNSQDYTPGALTQSTWYRRTVTSGGCSNISTVLLIKVSPVIAGNTISSAQTICSGSAPISLTGALPTGGSGSYVYSWESSTTSATTGFTAASGTIDSPDYTPDVLTQTTWYRRTISSGGCNNTSTAIQVSVTPILPVSVTIAPSANPVCVGTSVTFIATATNGGTPPVYQWKVNGVDAGTNSTTYAYIPANNDVVTCVLTSNASPCATGSPATSNSLTMTVHPIPSKPIANNVTLTYNGSAQSASATVLPGETVDWFTASSGGSATTAPTGTIAGTYSAYAQARNTTTGCLSTTRTMVTLTVTKATLTVTAENKTKVYDGAVFSPFTVSYSGFVNGETAAVLGGTLTYSGTATTAKNVGASYVITPGGLTSTNYNISFVNGTLAITQATVIPTITANNKCFDENSTVILSSQTLIGIFSPDDVTLMVDEAHFSDKDAGVGKMVIASGLSLGGADANNYILSTTTATTTADIIALPTIQLDVIPAVCGGTMNLSLPYTAAIGSPDHYSINFDVAAEGQGFVDVFNAVLSSVAMEIVVPGSVVAATYHATLTVKNSTTGCISNNYAIEITVNPTPTISGFTAGSSCGIGTVSLSATATAGTINWYAASVGGLSLASGTDFTTPILSTTTTYWVDATDNGCVTATRTPIEATVINNPVEVIASMNTFSACYPTLKAAFDAINEGTHKGEISILLNDHTTETTSAILNASGPDAASTSFYTHILIQPKNGGSRIISGNIAGALIDLNGADNVTIDGINTDGNSLTISNVSTATASTIRFILDAQNNVIQNCRIEGSGTGASVGTIFFSTALPSTGSGNDNNLISGNTITSAGANLPFNAIYSAGTSAGIDNSGNTVSNNNIQDFFSSTDVSNGIFVALNNSAWTVSNNKFYQTSTRTTTGGTNMIHRAIQITSGSGYDISGNNIGFAGSDGSGVMSYTNGGGTTTPMFRGIELFVGTSSPSSVQGNTISGIHLSTSSALALPGIFSGISVLGGSVNIGTQTGNTIGSSSGNGSITIASIAGGVITGIYSTSTGIVNIQNNTIGSFSTGSAETIGHTFYGIYTKGTLGNYSITSNTIGSSSTPNSISIGDENTTTVVCTFNGINNAATGTITISGNTIQNATVYGTAASVLNGILNTAGSGTLNIVGNNVTGITNTGTGAIIGISNTSTAATTNITSNIVRNIVRTTVAGTVTGISSTGAITGSLNIHDNSLGNVDGGFVTYNAVNSALLTGISVTKATATCALSIQRNDIRGISYASSGTGAHTYISNTATTLSQTISDNTFTDLDVNTKGNVTFITNSVAMPANGSQIVNGNRIVTKFNKGGVGNTVTGITSAAATINTGVTVNIENNNFSGITVTGATAINGIVNTDTGAGLPTKTIKNNTLSGWTGGTGVIQGMSLSGTGSGGAVTENTISHISNGNKITGITTGAGNDNIYSNNINSFSAVTTAAAVVTGIANAAGTTKNIYQNTISNLIAGTGITTGSVTGIGIAGGTTINVFQNTIYGLAGNAITTGSVNGISITGTGSINASQNKIYDLSSSSSLLTTGTVNGILISGTGVTANLNATISNNTIGDLRTPAASGVDLIRGISVTNSGSSSTINLYFNTISLDAASSGANFGTSGIYHTTSTTATTSSLDLRNNIVVNSSIPKGTGKTVAYRRSSNALNNYSPSSNNNSFYAGTAGPKNLIFYDGTNSDQTLAAYQTSVATRDQGSIAVNPEFISTTGSDPGFLHLSNTNCELDGAGTPISGLSIDFDNESRDALTPDIGADEFVLGVIKLPVSVTIVASLQGVICEGTGVTFTATPINGGDVPSFQWKVNGINVGTNIDTYHYIPLNNEMVTCVLTSNARCITGSPATSPALVMTVTPLPIATFSYPGSPYCSNETNPLPTYTGGGVAGTFSSTNGLVFISEETGQINLLASTPGAYTVTNTIGAAGGCEIITATYSVTINLDGSWTGAVNADWNNPGNWSCNQLPSITTDVLIANGKPHYPTLSGGDIGKVSNLSIANSGSVTVNGNTLQIAGAIANSGIFTATAGTIEMKGTAAQVIGAGLFADNTIMGLTVNNLAGVTLQGPLNVTAIVTALNGDLTSEGFLTLVSTVTQTALIDGIGAGNVLGDVTMQRYLPSAFGYKYFSSPFQAATVAEFAEEVDLGASFPHFYKYVENNSIDSLGVLVYRSGWVKYNMAGNSLEPLAGYAVNFGANVSAPAITANMTGVVSNGNLQMPLFNHKRKYTKGFNLVGNPYPSPIDWNAAGWTKTNIDNALYFFNASGSQYAGIYSSYVNGETTGNGSNVIGAMQGFFVHVSDGTYPVSGTLGVTNSVRINNLNPVFKRAVIDNRIRLRFTASFEHKNAIADPAVIYFENEAHLKFEKDLDALKMTNTDVLVPNIYTLTPESIQLSINGMPLPVDSISKIPLGISTFTDGWVTLAADDISRLPAYLYIYLLDGQTGRQRDLKQLPDYRFYLKAGQYNGRFSLVFSLSELSELVGIPGKLFSLIRSGNYIRVKSNLPVNTRGTLMVTNILGQMVLRREVNGNETVEINQNVSTGVYVISLHAGKMTHSEKVILKNDYE